VQLAACDQFTTVLAPGSNVYHYNHIHVDLMRRASGRRICQPRAMSGEEVAARLQGKNGPMLAQRQELRNEPRGEQPMERGPREPLIERDNDPFAWRGPSRTARDATGSIPSASSPGKTKAAMRHAVDDEDFLEDDGDGDEATGSITHSVTPRLSLPRVMTPAVVDTTTPQ
jgi:hypothetical protein